MSMAKTTGYGKLDCLSLPSLERKFLTSMRLKDDESKYTYTDKYMRHLDRQSIKGGNVRACNQYQKSENSIKVSSLSKKIETLTEIFPTLI